MDNNKSIELLKECISLLENKEIDIYSQLLMRRVLSSLEAASLLIDQDYAVEAPVLQRVSMEHIMRLVYVHKNPNVFKEKPDLVKMFGKGLRPTKTIEALAPELKNIYELLSAFTHPDALSLGSDNESSKIASHWLQGLQTLFVIFCLFEVYPYLKDVMDIRIIMEEANGIMVNLQSAFLNLATEQMIHNLLDTDIAEISASVHINEQLNFFAKELSEGRTLEEIVQMIMGGIND